MANESKNKVNKNNTKKSKKAEARIVRDKRSGNLKFFSIASVIILIICVILFNVLFENILGNKLKIDFTSTSQNTVSQLSIDYINSLPPDTHIRIVGLLDRPSNDTYGYSYIVPLLDDYAAESGGRITVEYKNPENYPSIFTELDPANTHNLTTVKGQYVVKCGDSLQVVSPMDCFEYDSRYLQYNSYVFTMNITESAFTSAIINVTTETSAKAYYIEDNSGESHSKLVSVLEGMDIEAEALPISSNFSVPDDCDLLFIANLHNDITADMALSICDYLDNGGKLIVALGFDSGEGTQAFENVNVVLDKMNLKLTYSSIQENDPNYYINVFESRIMPTTDYVSFTNGVNLTGQYLRQLKNSDNNKSYIQTATVLSTSSNATMSIMNGEEITLINEPAVYYVGMYSTYTGMANPPEVYAFGTTALTSDSYISSKGASDSNVVFLRSCIRDLLGDKLTDRNMMTIPGRNIADYSIDKEKTTLSTVNKIMFVFMVIIPFVFVITAVIVFKKRKNL